MGQTKGAKRAKLAGLLRWVLRWSSRKEAKRAKLAGLKLSPPDTSAECGKAECDARRKNYLNQLGIQKGRKCVFVSGVPTTKYEAEAKGSKLGDIACFACVLDDQHEPQMCARRPWTCNCEGTNSEPSLTPRSTISNDTEESGDEHGDMQVALFDLKRQDDFRLSYLRKLSYEKVWVPPVHRLPKHQTVTIFDWDDTLLCTHFLRQHEGKTLPKAVEAHLQFIENASKRLLEKSLQLGHTFIITNADEGWVEDSAEMYLPGLLPVLEKIRIISARSSYAGVYPREVCRWKMSAFLELQKELDLPVVTNLIAIGDSHYEMDAALVMGAEFEKAVVKTIQFREHPSPAELAKELKLTEASFEKIVKSASNLKMSLERRTLS